MDGSPGGPEWHTPPRYVVPHGANATDDIVENADRRPEHPAFARKDGAGWRTVTSREFADEVRALAAGLIAAGIQPGDRVALMSGTRYEWVLCDFAIWMAGAVSVPIYESSSAEQVAWILADSGATGIFAENKRYAEIIEGALTVDSTGTESGNRTGDGTGTENSPGTESGTATTDGAAQASIRHLWLIDADLGRLVESGRSVPADQVEDRRRGLTADSLATLVYTSGTTGRPRGCMISHGNLVAEVRNVARADGIGDSVLTEDKALLMFLPLAHIFARIVNLVAIHTGSQVAYTGDIRNVAADLRGYRPTLLLAVPRVLEKLYNTARRSAEMGGHGRLFGAAEATAVVYSQSLETGRLSLRLRARHLIFDRLVYARLRAAMGGRLTHACSGGAPLGARLGHFLRGAGVNVLEGWGLTETTSGVTLNLPAEQRIGTVGRPVPGCAVRIDPSGEVLAKGPSVFLGYWRNELATRDVFDADGWFRTGDLGRLDDGYVTITGRKKELIITAAGKNVAPAIIEDRLRAHWLIDQCLLVGDRLPYIGALITLDPEFLTEWQREHGKPLDWGVTELRNDADLRSTIQSAVDDANQAVSAAESIRRFRIVPGPFVVGAELTPTLKVRRDYVLAKYTTEIEALYAG